MRNYDHQTLTLDLKPWIQDPNGRHKLRTADSLSRPNSGFRIPHSEIT